MPEAEISAHVGGSAHASSRCPCSGRGCGRPGETAAAGSPLSPPYPRTFFRTPRRLWVPGEPLSLLPPLHPICPDQQPGRPLHGASSASGAPPLPSPTSLAGALTATQAGEPRQERAVPLGGDTGRKEGKKGERKEGREKEEGRREGGGRGCLGHRAPMGVCHRPLPRPCCAAARGPGGCRGSTSLAGPLPVTVAPVDQLPGGGWSP